MTLQNAKIIKADVSPDCYGSYGCVRDDFTVIKRGDKDYCMSRSELMRFVHNPHGWLMREGDDDGTESTEWGTLIDTLILLPSQFENLYAVMPEVYPGEKGVEKKWNMNAAYCKDWVEAIDGKTPIKAAMLAKAKKAVAQIERDDAAFDIIRNSQKQVLVYAEYVDDLTDVVVPIKTLIDLVVDPSHPSFGKAIGDFKTTVSAHPASWPRSVSQYNYDAQAWLYLEMFKAATGEDRTDFLHVIQDNWAPYEVGRRIMTTEFLELGRTKIERALQYYAQCLKYNRWPGYDDDVREQYHGFTYCHPEAWMVGKQKHLPILEPIRTPLVAAPDGEVTP